MSSNNAPRTATRRLLPKNLLNRGKMTDTSFLLTITITLFIAIYALAVIFLGDKGFGKIQMLFNLFNENSALIVIACGLSIVMVTGSIDISVGGSTALICTTCIVCLNNYGFNFTTSLLLALAIGLTFGIVQGFLIAYIEIQPFIVTLALMSGRERIRSTSIRRSAAARCASATRTVGASAGATKAGAGTEATEAPPDGMLAASPTASAWESTVPGTEAWATAGAAAEAGSAISVMM